MMILADNKAAPLRFLIGVAIAWVVVRGVVLSGWSPFAPQRILWAPGPGWLARRMLPPLREPIEAPPPPPVSWRPSMRIAAITSTRDPSATARWAIADGSLQPDALREAIRLRMLSLVGYDRGGQRFYVRTPGGKAAAVAGDAAAPRGASRWSASGWAFVRGGGFARPLAPVPVGQIGGGQAGARILYRLGGGVAAAARVSRTIGGPDQTEAAVGLDWQPVRAVPVHLTAERRIAIDQGGRNAFSIGAAGGVYAVPIATHWRLDGYGEAGVVGARRRDLYADGAIRAGREVAIGGGGATLTLGVGAWGAAQPHAARLDAGPSAVVRLPVDRHLVAIALDYRARLIGDARPHSGPALTVGIDF